MARQTEKSLANLLARVRAAVLGMAKVPEDLPKALEALSPHHIALEG